jgi:hypothetical protein
LDNAKQIWDTLKISHEGNDVTMLTKMELVEGELGRFAMIRGEEPTQTYNRLKTCNALNLGVEFFLLFSHQIQVLPFPFPFSPR